MYKNTGKYIYTQTLRNTYDHKHYEIHAHTNTEKYMYT